MIVTAAVQVKAFANGNKFRFLRLVGLSTLTGFSGRPLPHNLSFAILVYAAELLTRDNP
jgi:hypothetical protein